MTGIYAMTMRNDEYAHGNSSSYAFNNNMH